MSLKKLYLWATIFPIAASLIISFIILLLLFNFFPPELPLFYSLAWGTSQLGTYTDFLIIPANLALIAIANLSVALYLHNAQTFFKKILLLGTLISSIILIITFIKIVLIFI